MKILKWLAFAQIFVPGILLAIDIRPSSEGSTAEGTKHNCVDSSVTLSVSGNPTTPTIQCCGTNGTGSWTENTSQRSYSWSGDIQGGGDQSTATLNTSSVGDKSVSLTLTSTWTCSATSATTTQTDSGSYSMKIVEKTAGSACQPSQPSNGNISLGNYTVSNQTAVWSGYQAPYFVTIDLQYNGTMNNVSGNESYTKDSTLIPGGCGIDVNRQWTPSSPLNPLSLQLTLASYGPIQLSGTWPLGNNSLTINISRQEFKRAQIDVYKREITNATGNFTGTENWAVRGGGNSGTNNLNNKPLTATGANGYEWVQVHCFDNCCLSN